jgi:hypothetical protein
VPTGRAALNHKNAADVPRIFTASGGLYHSPRRPAGKDRSTLGAIKSTMFRPAVAALRPAAGK